MRINVTLEGRLLFEWEGNADDIARIDERVARISQREDYTVEQAAHTALRTLKQDRSLLESVRRDYTGLHSFLSMSLIEARRRKASALRLRFSQSLARRLQRPSHANVRSTTHRFGRTTNAFA